MFIEQKNVVFNYFRSEMSMAAPPLPPPLPHRHRYGIGGAAAADFPIKRCGAVAAR
jgi:hypothetical protein